LTIFGEDGTPFTLRWFLRGVDMSRSLVWLVCALSTIATVALAAPVPPPGEKELIAKHWGTTKGGGEFTLAGKQLTIRSVGQPAEGSVHYIVVGDNKNIPHVARIVTGDFEVTVRVADASAPNNKVSDKSDTPETRAGLFMFSGGDGVDLVLRQSSDAKREVRVTRWGGPCAMNATLQDVGPGKSVDLRLARKGNSFTVAYSLDGKTWSEPRVVKPFNFGVPPELTVGVLLVHNTYQEGASATFDNFTVTQPK
jgi:hypothetical protein